MARLSSSDQAHLAKIKKLVRESESWIKKAARAPTCGAALDNLQHAILIEGQVLGHLEGVDRFTALPDDLLGRLGDLAVGIGDVKTQLRESSCINRVRKLKKQR